MDNRMNSEASSVKYEVPNKATGYLPEVFSLLKSLDDEHVYGHEHQLSHPADIFILTFRDAIECINNLAKSVNEATETAARGEKLKDDCLAEIRRQVFDLLFYTGNFVEGCQSIIKSLFPRGDKRLTKAARVFRENVEEYTSHASQLINKVKHQHRRPRTFAFTYNNKIIVGYYLEGLVAKGVLGPDPELHKSYNSLGTGFSLNRAIPYHLCNLYYVSACLANVIKIHGRAGIPSEVNINDDYFRQAFSEAAQIPCILLPDEMGKPLPVVTRKDNENYLLEFPGKKEILNRKPHIANVHLEARIGVWDRGIAPPYMQASK
jgi:hypothetical protein